MVERRVTGHLLKGSRLGGKQGWREKSRGEAKKTAEQPEKRSGWTLDLESLVFEAVRLSELTWAGGVAREGQRAQDQVLKSSKRGKRQKTSLRQSSQGGTRRRKSV